MDKKPFSSSYNVSSTTPPAISSQIKGLIDFPGGFASLAHHIYFLISF